MASSLVSFVSEHGLPSPGPGVPGLPFPGPGVPGLPPPGAGGSALLPVQLAPVLHAQPGQVQQRRHGAVQHGRGDSHAGVTCN